MFGARTEIFGIEGVVGVRALTHYAGRFYSPVYGHFQWRVGVQSAACAIGCQTVPSERHMGCGFHAFWDVREARAFVEQIRATAICLVLIECFGRVVVHERGLRAERARVVAALDCDSSPVFDPNANRAPQSPSVQVAATRWFRVPLVDQSLASQIIELQRARCEAV